VSVNVAIGIPEEADKAGVKISVKQSDAQFPLSLKIRKTLEGNLIVFDHRDIDIVIMPQEMKVVAFPKNEMGSHVYDAEDRLFKFLYKMGVIKYGTVQGGAVYNSMQADIPSSTDYDSLGYVLYALEKWLDIERPHFAYEQAFYDEFEKRLTEPDEENSTEFDPRRQAAEKGSIRPGTQPFGLSAIYRL
jgi:hypothetical protein